MKLPLTPFEREILIATLKNSEVPTVIATWRQLDAIITRLEVIQPSYELSHEDVRLIHKYLHGNAGWLRNNDAVKDAVFSLADKLEVLVSGKELPEAKPADVAAPAEAEKPAEHTAQ